MNHSDNLQDSQDRIFINNIITRQLQDVAVADFPLADKFKARIKQARPGQVSMAFSVDRSFTQGGQVIQGGIIASLLDFGLGYAALTLLDHGQHIATVSMNIDYLRAAPAGDYCVHAKVSKRGKSLIYTCGELLSAANTVIATASSPIMIVSSLQ